MKQISIIPVTAADLEKLIYLSRKIFFDSFHHLNKPENMKEYMDRAFNPQQLLSELNNPLTEFYFIISEDTIAGYLKINRSGAQSDVHDEDSLEIERIYIDGEFQGHGLGALLISKAYERARAMGLKYIWLGVWEKNTGAKRFYERYGFIQFGSHAFRMGDEEQTDLLMRFDL
jgi:ribosomal protein S18 acetylase RimI-like enzyme